MKKIGLMSIIFLCCILLSGCAGREKEGEAWRGVQAGMEDLTELIERTEYYDIVSESEDIFHFGMKSVSAKYYLERMGSAQVLLGMQFYQGEPVQIWAEARPKTSDIFLYRSDGRRELLLQGVSTDYTVFDNSFDWNWRIGQEGEFYCWHRDNYSVYDSKYIDDDKKTEAGFVKLSASGDVVYEETFDPGVSVEAFCQLLDGRCCLLLKNEAEQSRTLAVLDSAAERFQTTQEVQMISPDQGRQYLGTVGEGLAVFNHIPRIGREIVELNPADKTQSGILSFTGTSYVMEYAITQMQDFRVLEDGSVELLWLNSESSAEGTLERLRMAKVEKIPIVVRGAFMSDDRIRTLAASFNRQSSRYHVVIEDCGIDNDMEDFARLTSIQLASGKGPDIIQLDFMQDYLYGMLEKGVMEDLSPYMEKSSIREEDYFPFVFGLGRDGGHIYSVSPVVNMFGYRMDESVLGGREEPDMEALADALLLWEGEAVFLTGKNSRELLEIFLRGTDTLWGMVEWEKSRCDFGGLLAKILETAKRYGDNGRKGQVSCIAEYRNFGDAFMFDSMAEQENEGKVTCGGLFDDGCHAVLDSLLTMGICSNSHNKEGAWEFLCFLLGDEVQSVDSGVCPVYRKGFALWLEKQREQVSNGKTTLRTMIKVMPNKEPICYTVTYTEENLTEEKLEQYEKEREEARFYPIRTAPILDIILEESEDYFNGSKSAEQVSEAAANRVQLYLDEISRE